MLEICTCSVSLDVSHAFFDAMVDQVLCVSVAASAYSSVCSLSLTLLHDSSKNALLATVRPSVVSQVKKDAIENLIHYFCSSSDGSLFSGCFLIPERM